MNDCGMSANSWNSFEEVRDYQIVNLYDATGRKYKTVNYTNMQTVNTDYNEIAYYTYDTDSIEYQVTEYLGNIMNIQTKEDSVITNKQKIFNATGYYADGRYYHYVKNHLGSICLVIDSETDSVIQNTSYSASGVPSSTNLDVQPYLYNGKEFVEVHGLNEYDSQARWYYAPIMRTTTMDPMAESYYHISPYAWCGNNPVTFIDTDGMAIYNFNSFGEFISKKAEEGSHYGAVYGENDELLFTFEFADPVHDPEAIDNGNINHVLLVTDEQISEILTKSGVNDANNKENKYSYIWRESNYSSLKGEGHMDYVMTGIYQGTEIVNYTSCLFVTNINESHVAHNTYNFGNFLWGAGASTLGIPYPIAKLGAHFNNYFFDPNSKGHLDSKDDQLSIKLGYLWQQGK